MSKNRQRFKKRKKRNLDGSFVAKAKKHGIFPLPDDELTTVDFLDVNSGKSLGIWKLRPWPQFIINGFARNGSMWQALAAIVAPYEL